MLRKVLSIVSLLAVLFGLLLTTSCGGKAADTSSAVSTNDVISDESGFAYPARSDLSFVVEAANTTMKANEQLSVTCSLRNNTDRAYYIERGPEAITYEFEGKSEVLDAIAVLDEIPANGAITRELVLTPAKSGRLTLTATIRIRPERYSEISQTYNYTQTLDIVVE